MTEWTEEHEEAAFEEFWSNWKDDNDIGDHEDDWTDWWECFLAGCKWGTL